MRVALLILTAALAYSCHRQPPTGCGGTPPEDSRYYAKWRAAQDAYCKGSNGKAVSQLSNRFDRASASPLKHVSVCELTWNTAELIGQRVRVEGYVFDLFSHGLALVDKRRQCSRITSVALMGTKVYPLLYKAVVNSGGPKRVIIVGTVRWHPATLSGGHNPGLVVEQVEYIGTRNADLKDF